MSLKVCYVTAYLNLHRDQWRFFSRSFEDYFTCFKDLLKPFKNANPSEYEFVIYIDSRHYETLKEYTDLYPVSTLISIDENFMNTNIPVWSRLEKEIQIMNSPEYKALIPSRQIYPENNVPTYTLINHAKIDFVTYTMDNISNAPFLLWADFGYCKHPSYTPEYLIDPTKLQLDKINYTLINAIDERDRDIIYTLRNAPEKIGGFFFFGNRPVLKRYQQLYHKILDYYQSMNIADDDQALVLSCYFNEPELFAMHNLGQWHQALNYFQKTI